MKAFQNDLHSFEKLNVQVLGISADSLATHNEFERKYGMKFPVLADKNGEIQKLYAPGRATFIIDKTGIIRFIHKGVPDNKTLLTELSDL